MLGKLKNKVAVVTCGGIGIGNGLESDAQGDIVCVIPMRKNSYSYIQKINAFFRYIIQ